MLEDQPKKSGKRRKQMARKGLHTDLDKDDLKVQMKLVNKMILSQVVNRIVMNRMGWMDQMRSREGILEDGDKKDNTGGVPGETALGKAFSNPFYGYNIANKLYGFQLTISVLMKSLLAQNLMVCVKASGKSKLGP
ncbi:hypothetical protein Tco_0608307 [Tanacetum coccineum]